MALKVLLLSLFVLITVAENDESNAIISNCETIPTVIRVTKEETDESGNIVRVCEGDVTVNKCEGTCASKSQPSVTHPTGFRKVECVCCRETWMDKKELILTDCFDADGKRLSGDLSALKAMMQEPKDCSCHKCANSFFVKIFFENMFSSVKLIANLFLIALFCDKSYSSKESCHLKPVIHVLKHPGCVPKPIPSFACQGSCSSYVQVIYVYTFAYFYTCRLNILPVFFIMNENESQISGSKFWSVERS
ncbi:lysine-specific histone demethylase 1A-like protein, partial [Leptotrombidium deliense]